MEVEQPIFSVSNAVLSALMTNHRESGSRDNAARAFHMAVLGLGLSLIDVFVLCISSSTMRPQFHHSSSYTTSAYNVGLHATSRRQTLPTTLGAVHSARPSLRVLH